MLKEEIDITQFNLGGENHRSPQFGILEFADAVLRNKSPLPETSNVKVSSYWPNSFEACIHAHVFWTLSALRQRSIENPSLAVLVRSNSLVSHLSTVLRQNHTYSKNRIPAIEHSVVVDAVLSTAAAFVVASVLEWPTGDTAETLARTLQSIATYYELKNSTRPTKKAKDLVRKFSEAAGKVAKGNEPNIQAAKAMLRTHQAGIQFVGHPIEDWRAAVRILHEVSSLTEISDQGLMVPFSKPRAALPLGLGERWLASGGYLGASVLAEDILNRERLIEAERNPQGCMLMSMHKSKGKEFDGVVLVEKPFTSEFFGEGAAEVPFNRSRRLLRVAITRAKTLVRIVRPKNVRPLVDPC